MIVAQPLKECHRQKLFRAEHVRFTWGGRLKLLLVMTGLTILFLYTIAVTVAR